MGRRLIVALVFSFLVVCCAQQGPSDTVLQNRITRILSAVPDFEGLDVSVAEGVITLSGTTPNGAIRDNAVALVAGLENVLYVIDETQQDTQVDKTLVPVVQRLRSYLTRTLAFLPLLGVALIVTLLSWQLAKWVGDWHFLYRRLELNPLLKTFVRQLVRSAVFLAGLILALDIMGATPFVAALLGTAGVAGLALGFAFRDIVENYLAGILLSARHPFLQNDLIELGGHSGVVVRLTTRELVLMTLDGNHVRIPNATVFKSDITNYTRNPRRRFTVEVGVDVAEELSSVQALGIDTLSSMKGVLSEPPPSSRIQALGDFNVILHFYGWVDQRSADFLKVESQAIRLIKETFDEAGVLMPEPITNVRVQEVPAHVRLGESAPAAETTPQKSLASVKASARAIDVQEETHISNQVREDLATSDEENLLEPPTRDSA